MALKISLAARALLALVLLVGFYLLAIAIAAGLLILAYAMIVYARQINVQLLLVCIISPLVIFWSILPRWDRFRAPGPELKPKEQPRLFAEVQAIADAVGQRMPREVYLVPDVNAWVAQRGGVLGIGSRRVMGLGLPLMQALSRSQLRAVLAHEFGHYHGGDTALGPLVYKTRATIIRTIQGLGNSIVQAPFLWYGKMFLRLTHSVSRHQEYAADALAARIVGARPLVTGLQQIHSASVAIGPYFSNVVAPALGAGYRPPFANGFARFLRANAISDMLSKMLEAEMASVQSNPYDTHPPLQQRIAALKSIAAGEPAADDSPAITLLDDVPGLEARLLASMFGEDKTRDLKPVRWEDLGENVHRPNWERLLKQHASALAGLTFASLPELARDVPAFANRLAKAVNQQISAEQAPHLTNVIVGAALAQALLMRGWTLHAEPGDPFTLRRGEEVIDPFKIFPGLASGELSADDWRRQCEWWGIATVSLKP